MISTIRTLLLLAAVAATGAWGQALTVSTNPVAFTAPAGSATPVSQSITLTNSGAAATFTTVVSQPWISVNPASGSLAAAESAPVEITVNPGSREAGQHSGTVTFRSPGRPDLVVTVNLTSQGGVITLSATSYALSLTAAQTSTRDFTISFSGGATQVALSSNAPWLITPGSVLTSFPTTVTTQINPSALAPGNYTGVVTVSTVGGASAVAKTFTIALTVLAPATNMTLSTSPSPVTYTDTAGSTTKKTATVTVTNTGPSVIYAIEKAQAWITFSDPTGSSVKVVGTAPENGTDTFNIIVDPVGLAVGTYSDTVTVKATGRPTRTIVVTLIINPAPDMKVAPASLNFAASAGSASPTPAQTVSVQASGAGFNYTVTKNQTWVILSKATGSVGTNASDTFTVAADHTYLPANTDPSKPYTATVTVTATGRPTRVIPVTLNLSGGVISVSPASINVAVPQGSVLRQDIAIGFQPATAAPVVNVEVTGAGQWLSVGRTQLTAFPAVLPLTIDATSLGMGPQAATIRLSTAAGSSIQASQVLIYVFVNVVPPAGLRVEPPTAAFTAARDAGATEPPSIPMQVQNPGPAAAYTLSSSAAWIVLSKTSGTVGANGVDSFTLGASAAGLGAGQHNGTVMVQAAGRTPLTVAVTLTVRDGGPGGGAAPAMLIPSKVEFFAEPGQTPPPQLLTVVAEENAQSAMSVLTTSMGAWLGASASTLTTPGSVALSVVSTTVALPASGEVQVVPTSADVPSAQVPVTLRSAGPRVYSIPRVADGRQFTTEITLANLDTVPARVTLRFHKAVADGATEPWTPSMEDGALIADVEIPVGAAKTWRTRGQDAVDTAGWAEVICAEKLGGLAVFRQQMPEGLPAEAAVPLNSGWQQRFLQPFDNRSPYEMAMALTNADAAGAAVVEAVFRDEQGNLLPRTWKKTLPPMGHIAFTLAAEFPWLAGLRGTAEFFTTGGRMSALGLRFSGGPFTSFEPQSLNTGSTGRYSVAQVADGGGFTTAITAVNNDTVVARVRLRLFKHSGSGGSTGVWNPAWETGTAAEVLIRPGASYTWRTKGAGALTQGWAELISAQRISGFAVFRQSAPGRADQEAAVPVSVGGVGRFLLPFNNVDFVTSMALANISERESATVEAVFRDEQGRVLRTETITIPLRGHDAFELTRYRQLERQRGVAEFRVHSGEVSVIGLRFSSGGFTSFRPQVY